MAISGDLGSLFASDLPEGRQNLLDSFTNLERVAEYCENNYFQCDNKRQALEETKGYTTQSLASVAYQINTLAYNFLQMLDLQSAQLSEMASQVNHISQTVEIHKEKVARREIGILTTNKSSNRQYKIIAPANPERPAKYIRKPIDYSILDDIGHGVKLAPPPASMSSQSSSSSLIGGQKRPSNAGHYGPGIMMGTSQYAPGTVALGGGGGGSGSAYGSLGNVSTGSGGIVAGPAPTSKPPTPPQTTRYPTLTRPTSKEYRTPSMVTPPQLPSNYAPNYPRTAPGGGMAGNGGGGSIKQYGTLPHPQVQMVHPVPHQQYPHDDPRYGGATTMPRLSSNSVRSVGSMSSNSGGGGESAYGRLGGGGIGGGGGGGTLGRVSMQQQLQAASNSSRPLSASQYAPGSVSSGMARPSQRPPSPPLPPPPGQQMPPQQQQQFNPVYARHQSVTDGYSRQSSVPSSMQQMDAGSNYSRQSSTSSMQQLGRQNSSQLAAAAAAGGAARQVTRQSSLGGSSGGFPHDANLPGWVPKTYMEKVTAIYDYNADKEDELSFQEGSTIYVLKKNDDGWWEGVMDGITGLFPGNYVEGM